MGEIAGVEQTLDYWFGPLTREGLPIKERFALWFGKDSIVDAGIRERFGCRGSSGKTGSLV